MKKINIAFAVILGLTVVAMGAAIASLVSNPSCEERGGHLVMKGSQLITTFVYVGKAPVPVHRIAPTYTCVGAPA